MLEIFNTKIYGLEESLIASGYPMREDVIGEWDNYPVDVVGEKEFERGGKLGSVPTGTGHDNYLKGITVQFDVKYPNYWTPQFQRYNFIDIVSSTSKMHRITKMDINETCNKYVDERVKEVVKFWVDVYNSFEPGQLTINVLKDRTGYFRDGFEITKKEKNEEKNIEAEKMTKYEVYMRVISSCPLGLEQTMRVSTSYLQLKTIYQQRKNHKLQEDWGAFCQWCENLPHFKELCIKEE